MTLVCYSVLKCNKRETMAVVLGYHESELPWPSMQAVASQVLLNDRGNITQEAVLS